MLEATGGSKVFATLMSSMAATAEKEDIRTFFFLEDVEVDFENLSLLGQEDNDDDDDSLDGVFFNVEDAEEDEVNDDGYEDSEDDHDVRHHNLPHPPPQKKQRFIYERKPQDTSLWWTTPHVRDEYITDRDGRVGRKFRRLFCVPFSLFLNLVSMAKDRWWQEWTPQKVDAAGKLVSNLELVKLLGALFVLGNGCSHYIVST
jgi:hypothetical protein